MNLEDPVVAYNAESNIDAVLVQRFLESEGIQAFVIEDNSLVGYWMFGMLPEIHKPQVWVNRADAESVSRLLTEYERRRAERDAQRKASEPQTFEATCEECGKVSTFAGSLLGTVQDCGHCGAYLDVGEVDWPDDDDINDAQSET